MRWTDLARLCLALTLALAARGADAQSESNGTVPNFVLLSHDDALINEAWQLMLNSVLKAGDFRNPNGCRIPVTWFVGKQGRNEGDCEAVQAAYSQGHEMASHTLSHSKEFGTFDVDQLKADMDGVRVWMNETCGIPKDVITGFRAPNFDTSDALGQALVQLGFLYDSSVQEESYRQRPGRLDDPAFKLKCRVAPCLNWTGLPFWEVPTYGLEPPAGRRTNPGNVGNVTALQRLQNDWQRKQGSGVPTLIMAHRQYLEVPTERDDVVAFIGWALDQPNTWFLTYQQLIAYLAAPPGTPIEHVVEEFACDDSA